METPLLLFTVVRQTPSEILLKRKPYIGLFSLQYMEELIYDMEAFLQRAREHKHEHDVESYEDTTFRNYEKFSNLEEYDDYYQQIKVCKAILNDIKSQSPYVLKMGKYCPEISELVIEDVTKIRYNAEEEAYIVYARGTEYEIYEGDIRFIYPSLAEVPDSSEYEVVIEDSSVYVYNKFTSDPPFRVLGFAEADADAEAEPGAEAEACGE